jgi:hypothetical protein
VMFYSLARKKQRRMIRSNRNIPAGSVVEPYGKSEAVVVCAPTKYQNKNLEGRRGDDEISVDADKRGRRVDLVC